MIGNPPYVLLEDEFRDDKQISYFRSKFTVASYKLDTYHLFIELGVKILENNGYFSMITPANFITNNYLAPLRRYLLTAATLQKILVIEKGVFQGISVDNAILVVSGKQKTEEKFELINVSPENDKLSTNKIVEISIAKILDDEFVLYTGSESKEIEDILDRVVSNSVLLKQIAHVNFGKQLRNRKDFPNDVIEVENLEKIQAPYKACYTGRNVQRYVVQWANIACFDNEVARRGGSWDNSKHNARNKLLTRQIGSYPEFGIDYSGFQCLNTMFMINVNDEKYDPHFVLGILNSSLLKMYWLNKFSDPRKTFPKIKGTYLGQLPIQEISSSESDTISQEIIELTKLIVELYQRLATANTPQEQNALQRQIDATDRQIDQLVYELYGLTEEEIRIVEAAS